MLVCGNLIFSSAAFSVMEDHVKYTRNTRLNIYTVIVINMFTGTVTLREEEVEGI